MADIKNENPDAVVFDDEDNKSFKAEEKEIDHANKETEKHTEEEAKDVFETQGSNNIENNPDAVVFGDEDKSFKAEEKEIERNEKRTEKETAKEAKETFEPKDKKGNGFTRGWNKFAGWWKNLWNKMFHSSKKNKPAKESSNGNSLQNNPDAVVFDDDDKKSFLAQEHEIDHANKEVEKHTAEDAKDAFEDKENN